MAWPPTLVELKDDLAIPPEDTEDDGALTRRLDATVEFVQRVRRDAFVTDEAGNLAEPVTFATDREARTLELGTLMAAGRFHARRRSPDAILFMAETGTTKVSSGDNDIDRLLRIGRHAKPKVG